MKPLSYQTLEEQGYEGFLLREAPERVLQFGEGNFLRAFVECFVDSMNETADFNGKVVQVQPIPQGMSQIINDQEGLYTLILRGQEQGAPVDKRRVISAVSRCIDPHKDFEAFLRCAQNPALRFIVSNTTEAGIAFDPACKFADRPPASFPAKVTRLLYERYACKLPGFVVLPCELIDNNGIALKQCVEEYMALWCLDADFIRWVERENVFCSTLVDRIVTGFPQKEKQTLWSQLGYRDDLLDVGEAFGLWVMEGPPSLKEELPFEKANLPIRLVADHSPYKRQKVRILNGAHTAMVPAAFLGGWDIVRDAMEDPLIHGFVDQALYKEIIPTLDLPKEELEAFAASVKERFANPFVDHSLLAITLNCTSKWKARILPSLLAYAEKNKSLPACLTFSFAAYLAFYRKGEDWEGDSLIGHRNGDVYRIQDEPWVLAFFYAHRQADAKSLIRAVLENQRMWDPSLAGLPGFAERVTADLEAIEQQGIVQAMGNCLEEARL